MSSANPYSKHVKLKRSALNGLSCGVLPASLPVPRAANEDAAPFAAVFAAVASAVEAPVAAVGAAVALKEMLGMCRLCVASLAPIAMLLLKQTPQS